MAKNTGKGHRIGAVTNRSEFRHPNGTYVKRDTTTGRIMNVSDNPHKGVRDEKLPRTLALGAGIAQGEGPATIAHREASSHHAPTGSRKPS